MPAPITIIIPTHNAVSQLGPTLSSVFAGVESGLLHKVIFADGGSSDDIKTLSDETGAELIVSPKGRGTQLSFAAKSVNTDWILFLHADTNLSPNWVKEAQNHIISSKKAAYFRLEFDEQGFASRWIAGWANFRSRLFDLPYGDQGLLITRDLYQSVGGYLEIPLMEDVAMARKLRGQLTPLKATARTSAGRYKQDGWMARGWRNLTTLALYFAGQSPEKLAQRYK